MIKGSQDVNILQRGGNIWGMRKGNFGVADFTTHCYAVKINPPNLNNLIMIAKEVPTTDSARFEQNRIDALINEADKCVGWGYPDQLKDYLMTHFPSD